VGNRAAALSAAEQGDPAVDSAALRRQPDFALSFTLGKYKRVESHFRYPKVKLPHARQPASLQPNDIKLLRVFMAVTEAGSFANAQSMLNVSASTISTRITTLEQRLGMRLCERGRSGFRLTDAGRTVLEASKRLFAAHDEFSDQVWLTRRHQEAVFKVGVVDNVVFNPELRLVDALNRLCRQEGPLELHVSTMPPSELEQSVLSGELDVGVGVFLHKVPGLHYETFLRPRLGLFCGRGHELFEAAPDRVTVETATAMPYVARAYMGERASIPGLQFKLSAYAQSMEACALLVLSGHYLAHLPVYYAKHWTGKGMMRPIRPDRFEFENLFGYATRESRTPRPLVATFTDLLLSLHGSKREADRRPAGIDRAD